MIVLISVKSTKEKQIFAFPKDSDGKGNDWVEIVIDYTKNEFFAKKIKSNLLNNEDWKVVNNFTFPSSLFSKFLFSEPINIDEYL